MQVFLEDIARLGTPPYAYESADHYQADVRRLGEIVAESGDLSEVDAYARVICSHRAGAGSVLAFTTATPNFCWDMDKDSPFYAVECFLEDVSDPAAAFESESPAEDDDPEDEAMEAVELVDGSVGDGAVGPMAQRDLTYYVFLDDGATYSGLGGCTIVGIRSSNRRAWRALDADDFEAFFDRADLVEPIPVPAWPA